MRHYVIAAGHKPGIGARGNNHEEGALATRVANALVNELNTYKGVKARLDPHAHDYRESVEWIRKTRKPGERAIELHFDSARSSTATGALVAGTDMSKRWGSRLAAVLRAIVGGGHGYLDHSTVADWRGWGRLWFPYALDDAVLVELGFITNPNDIANYATPARRKKNVQRIAAVLAETPGKRSPLTRWIVRDTPRIIRRLKQLRRKLRKGKQV